ncbi:T9SS type B sorting domain-containing protein [Aquimarina sp. RZ0]|uniref:lectin-like domain-containing protein n=1 Tax=Aquimarina sp. RZ0 TaxID=2607730 RepID=UPI0011F3875E|nr:T9SS type B sorting domain-containing protein [Aquimarina sp. RZ0]KAA1243683.1 T9SS type B sorting domain-containing protein [Aquimarina sp. RZ0]
MAKNYQLHCFFIFFFSFYIGHSQLIGTTIGSATDLGNNCFEITPSIKDQVGGVWYGNPINFDEDFTIIYEGNFGTFDADGADGIALVFKNDATPVLGNFGEGIGYGGINQSLVIELDTFQNPTSNDPTFDHVAITRDGNTDHGDATNLSGPVQASATDINIEDGLDHLIKIEWIAGTTTLNVFFDCDLRLSYTGDVKTDIFFGDDTVHFGFVSSTGFFFNSNQLCFNSISFVEDLILNDTTICLGDSVLVDVTLSSAISYNWSPVVGVSDPTIPNPELTPTTTTNYVVTITDQCGDVFTEDILVTVNDLLGTAPSLTDSTLCIGDSVSVDATTINAVSYIWSPAVGVDNPISPIVTLSPTTTTTYTVTITGQCGDIITEDVLITIDGALGTTPLLTDSTLCAGDFVSVDATTVNAVSYAWSPAVGVDNPISPVVILSPTVTTTYTVTITGQCGDVITEDVVVSVDGALGTPSLTDNTICIGDSVSADAITVNAISYVWSPVIGVDNPISPIVTLSPTTTTTYTVTITGQCGDVVTEDVLVTVTPLSIPSFDPVDPICFGDSLADLPTTDLNGIMGSWSPAIDNTVTTTYTFTPQNGSCSEIATLTIDVNSLPVITLEEEYLICKDSAGNNIPIIIATGLSNIDYTFEWLFNGVLLSGENVADLSVQQPGLYEVRFTDMTTNCENVATTEVIEVTPPDNSITINQLTANFSQRNTLEVVVSGDDGSFEYQLDNGPWQRNNIFTDILDCGLHTITVRGNGLCNNLSESIFLLNYPRFFTPNNDSFNDRWTIDCVADQPEASLFIFDHYGKLLSVFKPSESSWDGTYLGRPLPSTDYWFVLEYNDPEESIMKKFRSHFSLKR